jgi:hypothetical protein
MASIVTKPEVKVSIGGEEFGVVFDLGTNPTKRGVKMKFVPLNDQIDIRQLSDIAAKITLVLQKKLAPHGIIVNRDTQVENPMIIGFLIPLDPIADFIISKLKGQ